MKVKAEPGLKKEEEYEEYILYSSGQSEVLGIQPKHHIMKLPNPLTSLSQSLQMKRKQPGNGAGASSSGSGTALTGIHANPDLILDVKYEDILDELNTSKTPDEPVQSYHFKKKSKQYFLGRDTKDQTIIGNEGEEGSILESLGKRLNDPDKQPWILTSGAGSEADTATHDGDISLTGSLLGGVTSKYVLFTESHAGFKVIQINKN